MKSFVSFSFVILAVFDYLLLASASPTPSLAESTADTPEQKVITWMTNNPTQINPPCFFSGFTQGTGKVYNTTDAAVRQSWVTTTSVPDNCVFLNQIVAKAGVKEADIKDWGTVSERFAQMVKGKVYVLLGKTVNPTSIWLTREAPALKANKGVTQPVERWEIEANGIPRKLN